jgi:KDO2-lipid IV(A) lauroyltransferase
LIGRLLSQAYVGAMRLLARAPLGVVRALGRGFGWVLYALAIPRRRVVHTNLKLCFPHLDERERRDLVKRNFLCFAQSWLDRSWLWHAPPDVVQGRLRLLGDDSVLRSSEPVIVFSPHFYGLDAGWMVLSGRIPRRWSGLYAEQSNKVLDQWLYEGRTRFGDPHLVSRTESTKSLAATLRAGGALCLLPDTNHGSAQAKFVPFYGTLAATATSLPRFARMGRARVVPVITRMTPSGYDVEIQPVWDDYPGGDDVADTALMNARLEGWINTMPEQYWWVAKRFKLRPRGEPPIY